MPVTYFNPYIRHWYIGSQFNYCAACTGSSNFPRISVSFQLYFDQLMVASNVDYDDDDDYK